MTALAGTGALIRLVLRRDRLVLPAWIVVVAGLAWASAASFATLYPTAEARRVYAAEVASNPAVVALLGPVFDSSVGGLVAWRWTIQGVFFAGLASLLTVVRHTRSDEEAGRRELLQSALVGRQAPLTAALVVTVVANLVVAALVAGGLVALGLPPAGSLCLGLSVAALGCTVAAAASVAAQLAETAGAARALVGALAGVWYLLRVAGDVSASADRSAWPSWLSPIGWARLTRPFADERWWVFGLFLAAAAALVALAYALSARRDLGAGLVPESAGSPVAGPLLSGPFGLAWRLHRGALIAWAVIFAIVGAAFGFVVKTVSDLLTIDRGLSAFFTSISSAASPSDVVFHLYFLTFGPLIALYAIQAALRARAEELGMGAESLLAAPLSRTRWMAGHLLFALVGPVVVLGALGLAAGLAYGSSTGDVGGPAARVLAAALVYLPALWVVAGIAAVQFGVLPRLPFLSWGAWLVFALIDFAHERQLVGESVYGISPFAHVPKVLLGETVVAGPLLALLALAVMLALAGTIGFNRRDVGSG